MSLSINHPRLLKNEVAGLDQRTIFPATTRLNSNVPPFGTTIPKVPNAPGLDNKMLTADTALSQVFGRLELILNAIRERLSGQPPARHIKPQLDPLKVPPDAREQTVVPDESKPVLPPAPTPGADVSVKHRPTLRS